MRTYCLGKHCKACVACHWPMTADVTASVQPVEPCAGVVAALTCAVSVAVHELTCITVCPNHLLLRNTLDGVPGKPLMLTSRLPENNSVSRLSCWFSSTGDVGSLQPPIACKHI
jgi:hypothetical protein